MPGPASRSAKTPREIAEERFRMIGFYIEAHAADLASELGEMCVAEGGLRVSCDLTALPIRVTVEKDYIVTDRRLGGSGLRDGEIGPRRRGPLFWSSADLAGNQTPVGPGALRRRRAVFLFWW